MKGGVFRGILAACAMAFARLRPNRIKTNHYPDPLLRDPHLGSGGHKHPRGRSYQGKPRLGRPPCDFGTITYHDKLVRHFGRREADRIQRAYRADELDVLPF